MGITRSTQVLAVVLAGSGVIHLGRPRVYEPLMPTWVPAHHEVIVASGVAELALAAGLLAPRTRRAAGWGSAALLVGVFPGNLEMTRKAYARRNRPLLAASIARLPLQWPAIRAALDAARG